MFLRNVSDAQQLAYNFLVNQLTIIEPIVAKIVYPDVQYRNLVPIETLAGTEWAKSVTYISTDMVGAAAWFHAQAQHIPIAEIARDKAEKPIEMAGIGFTYDLQELNQSRLLGLNISTDKADAATRASEEFCDNVALRGNTDKAMTGLINDGAVTIVTNPADGTGPSTTWATKTVDKVLRDFNSVLQAVYTGSLTTEVADTVLLPVDSLLQLGAMLFSTATPITALQWIMENNVYTQVTGRPLSIAPVRGLEVAGAGATKRMVAYRRDPAVLRMHIPMTHRFLPPWQRGPIVWDVPGIMRLSGVEIRRPGAVRYLDGI